MERNFNAASAENQKTIAAGRLALRVLQLHRFSCQLQ